MNKSVLIAARTAAKGNAADTDSRALRASVSKDLAGLRMAVRSEATGRFMEVRSGTRSTNKK